MTKNRLIIIQGRFPKLSATFILDEMTGLVDRGFELENWASSDAGETTLHPDIEKYGFLKRTSYLHPKKAPAELAAFPDRWTEEVLRAHGLSSLDDISGIHVHFGARFNDYIPLFKVFKGFVLVSFHGYDASQYIKQNGSGCYDFLFERADLITVPSQFLGDNLLKIGGPAEKIVIHRYGINTSRFCLTPQKLNRNEVKLLSVARFVEKKGLEYSLRAFAALPRSLKARYQLVGDGPLEKALRDLVGNLGISDRVDFLGVKDKQGVVSAMQDADIIVLTSVTAADGDTEGLPVSLIEAQASGLPAVSSYHSGIPELVVHGETGLLARERDVQTITENMRQLIELPDLRKKMGAAAAERVRVEFDIKTLNDRLAEYINSGIERKAQEGSRPALHQASHSCPNTHQSRDRKLLRQMLEEKGWDRYFERFAPELEEVIRYNEVPHPAISVVIISWRLHPLTKQVLQALHRERSLGFELIFVNNGAPDAEFGPLKPYIDTYVRLKRNTGAYLARNIGSAFARAPILMFHEDDGIPVEGLIQAHLDAFRAYDVIAVRGAYFPLHERWLWELPVCLSHYYRGDRPCPDFPNVEGNCSFESNSFFAVGGWDNDINFGGGGMDISIRLLAIEPDYRKQMYTPDAVIRHDYVDNLEQFDVKREKQEKSRQRLRKKHPQHDFFRHFWDLQLGGEDLLVSRNSFPNSPPAQRTTTFNPLETRKVLEQELIAKGWDFKFALYRRFINCLGFWRLADSPTISLVFASSNPGERLLQNLLELNPSRSKEIEIILINSGQPDRSFAKYREFIDVYIKLCIDAGLPIAWNMGAAFSRSPALLFLYDDALLEDGTIKAHLDALSRFNAVSVQGRIVSQNAGALHSGQCNLGLEPVPTYTTAGGNTSFDTKAFLAAGGWDEQIRTSGGGLDLSRRLLEIVPDVLRQVYCPSPTVVRDAPPSDVDPSPRVLSYLKQKYPDFNEFVSLWQAVRGRTELLASAPHT